jgi:hypothetical protein
VRREVTVQGYTCNGAARLPCQCARPPVQQAAPGGSRSRSLSGCDQTMRAEGRILKPTCLILLESVNWTANTQRERLQPMCFARVQRHGGGGSQGYCSHGAIIQRGSRIHTKRKSGEWDRRSVCFVREAQVARPGAQQSSASRVSRTSKFVYLHKRIYRELIFAATLTIT